MSLQKSKSHRMLRGNGAQNQRQSPITSSTVSPSLDRASSAVERQESGIQEQATSKVALNSTTQIPIGMQSNAVYEEPPPLPMIYDFDPNDPVWTYEILDFTEDVRRICPRLLQDKKLLGWQIDCEDPDIPGKFRLKMERTRLEKIHERMRASYDNLRMQRPSDPNLVITDGVDKTEIVTADQIAKHLQAKT